MKCQSLSSLRKKKKENMSSAESAQRVVKVNVVLFCSVLFCYREITPISKTVNLILRIHKNGTFRSMCTNIQVTHREQQTPNYSWSDNICHNYVWSLSCVTVKTPVC